MIICKDPALDPSFYTRQIIKKNLISTVIQWYDSAGTILFGMASSLDLYAMTFRQQTLKIKYNFAFNFKSAQTSQPASCHLFACFFVPSRFYFTKKESNRGAMHGTLKQESIE
jgi:hypothetical protein